MTTSRYRIAITGRTGVPFNNLEADTAQGARRVAAEVTKMLGTDGVRARISLVHTGARIPLVAPETPHGCGIECTGAGLGSLCQCECGGLYHAVLHLDPERRPGYKPSPANAFARIPGADDSDDPW